MRFSWKKGRPKVAFITGGSSGIGLEFARLLAQEGCNVAIFSRRPAPEAVEKLRQLAVTTQQEFVSYVADVAQAHTLTAVINDAVEELGQPDLVINSAGITISKPFEELSAADFSQVVEVNLVGSRNLASAVLPHLRQGAHLVLVASIAGLVSNYAYAAYCASKFGTVGLAAVLRLELKLKGIDVSVCCPAEINTPLVVTERQTLHPVSAALKDFVGTMEVGPACQSMMKQIARRKFEIIPGVMARLSAMLNQYFPRLARWISDYIALGAMKRYNQNR